MSRMCLVLIEDMGAGAGVDVLLPSPLRSLRYSLDAVEDLMQSNVFSTTFDAMAKKLPDLERMLSRIHAKSCKKQEL